MPHYRVTIRYGAPQARYEMLDFEADDLRSALREAATRLGEAIAATAELAEVRVQRPPDEREFGPE